MLDELILEQFVEGVNEGEEQPDEDTIVITRYLGTGLLYIPQTSYILTKLQIGLTFGQIPKDTEIGINLYSDYKDKPSNIVLSSGSFIPKEVYGGWREITLQAVSLIKGKKYWVTIHPNGCPTALLQAKEGQSLVLSVRAVNLWGIPREEVKEGKVMLRFYGRILPTSV